MTIFQVKTPYSCHYAVQPDLDIYILDDGTEVSMSKVRGHVPVDIVATQDAPESIEKGLFALLANWSMMGDCEALFRAKEAKCEKECRTTIEHLRKSYQNEKASYKQAYKRAVESMRGPIEYRRADFANAVKNRTNKALEELHCSIRATRAQVADSLTEPLRIILHTNESIIYSEYIEDTLTEEYAVQVAATATKKLQKFD